MINYMLEYAISLVCSINREYKKCKPFTFIDSNTIFMIERQLHYLAIGD